VSEQTKQQQGQRVLGCLSKPVLLILVLFLAFVSLVGVVGSGQIDAGLAIVFGWINFLQRTVPSISWNWDLIGMAALCVVLIALMGHRFASWMVAGVANRSGKGWRWRWRWTWGGLAGLGLMFLVGMSVGGAAHQIGWMAGSQEPWFERKPRFVHDMIQMRDLEREIQFVLAETNMVAGVRQRLIGSEAEKRSLERRKISSLQSFHVLFVSTNRQQVDGVIIFPRAKEASARLHGLYVSEADRIEISPAALPAFVKEREPYLMAY
jgi:hypothetical protein